MNIDTPNLVVPLAASYNERGVNGYAATVTNGLDQRKVNSIYEPGHNAITGATTLRLAKRPGVVNDSHTYGDGSQIQYCLIVAEPITSAATVFPWVFSKEGNNIRASDTAGTNTIVTSAAHIPLCVDRISISGTDTVFLQTAQSSSIQRLFYASAINSWTEVTDTDFTSLNVRGKIEPMDGYLFAMDKLNRIYNSDLNSISSWTPVNFITKQIQLDEAIGMARFNNQLLAFGGETTEVFYNVGNGTGSPLATVRDHFQRVGNALTMGSVDGRTSYYAVLQNRLYIVGTEAIGSTSLGVYVYDGSLMTKVSPPSIDKMFVAQTVYTVTKVEFYGRAAVAFGFTVPSAATQKWLMYFPEWNEWFEWTSTVFGPVNCGSLFLGATDPTKVYKFDGTDNWQDDGTTITTTHQFKIPKTDNARSYMGMFGVKADTARSASSLTVDFSDDDWQSFYTAGTIDLTQVTKKAIYQCGSYTDRGVRLTHTANDGFRIESALARIS